jgi:integrase
MSRGKRGPLAKPRYRTGADRWEVKVDGKYVPILDEYGAFIRGDGRGSELKANASWHMLLQREQAKVKGGDNLVAVVLDLYLDEVARLHPPLTGEKESAKLKKERRTFQSFLDLFPKLTVNDLTEEHIDKWFAAHPEWESSSTRKTYLSSLTAAFNWASRGRKGKRLIPTDHPLHEMDLDLLTNKAYHRRRGSQTKVDDHVHVFLVNNVPEDFRQVLFALRHTGTRPGNICKVTAANFREGPGVWVFEEDTRREGDTVHKTYDATQEALFVPLTEVLVELCKRLKEKYPDGPLFRKADGEPWTAQAIADRFISYRDRFRSMGVPIPETCFAYCYRHQTATGSLARGESDALVAAMLGHQGARTLHKHYNHPLAKVGELVSALRRQVRPLPGEVAAVGGDGGGPEPPEAE